MNEDLKRLWTWKSWKLVLLDFGIINIFTGADSFELSITTKEPSSGEKTVNYIWNPEQLEKFQKDIANFNGEVSRIKNFKDKLVCYNCGEQRMRTSLYFKKEEWQKFHNLIQEAYKNYLDQRKIYMGF